MKKSVSMIIILSSILVIGLTLLFILLYRSGFNIFAWLFSNPGLLVLFALVIVGILGFIFWYRLRDR